MDPTQVALLLFLYLGVCLCQHDCTGVDCPLLDNCIQEVLENGDCCSSCVQKGCTCEGYQYYDCINAGFKNGKVPEGDSYFVDYGSTECSCPAGGGRISCHFISCPEMPPNCIEVSEPADGCMQCERVGCIDGEQKYQAGHSFHIEPCRVCHCPNEGGKLMCYPVPDCDPQSVHKPMLAAPTEENTASRPDSYPYRFDSTDQFSSPYHLSTNGNLPLFKPEDYDYGPTDFPETHQQSLILPTQSFSSTKGASVSRTSGIKSSDRQDKLELRERYGVHEHPADMEKATESLQSTVRPHMHATASWQHSQDLTSNQSVLLDDQTELENPLHTHKSLSSFILPLNRGLVSEKQPEYLHVTSESATYHQGASEAYTHPQKTSDSVTHSEGNISHPVEGTEVHTSQEGGPDTVSFPLYMPRSPEIPILPQGSVRGHKQDTPDDEEMLHEGVEQREEDKMTLTSVTEDNNVPYKLKPRQQERGKEVSEGSYPTSAYEKTTPEPSTRHEYQTTPMIHVITTTPTTQPPLRVKVDESQPSRKNGQHLHREEGKEEVTKTEEERKHHPALVKPDGGKSERSHHKKQNLIQAWKSK